MAQAVFCISNSTTAQYKDSGSRFIAHAFPVKHEVDIKGLLNALHQQYPDATHICYAWSLGQAQTKAADDGEPAHSAGSPILRQIQAMQLTNTLVAVVRYYGGKKLGIPGLILAYGEAARLALEGAIKVTFEEKRQVRVKFPYHLEGEVNRLVKLYKTKPLELLFEECVTLALEVDKQQFEALFEALSGIYGLEILPENQLNF
jgi:uncharacterized YigZ family protein